MGLEEKVEVLEARIIELEKINAFQEEESKDYVTKGDVKLVDDEFINHMSSFSMNCGVDK